jgi:predicted GNAT family N-acyltransferase
LADQVFLCAARLKEVQSRLLLTGVACAEEFRGKGLASLLINNIISTQQQDIYCFPYPHLQTFYEKLGFIACLPEQLPEALLNQYQAYTRHNPLLCMVKCK